MYKIAVIPGDGIGKEVMEATLHILDASNVGFEYNFADAGDDIAEKTGIPLPKETIDVVKPTEPFKFPYFMLLTLCIVSILIIYFVFKSEDAPRIQR